jgi:hypothetical protein
MTPHFLRANLCFLHGTMRASEGLLRAAIRKGEVDDLGLYFTQHLAEESGHLEMLEEDLRRLGVRTILQFPEAAALAGAQYYYIEHEHPALLLGYMAAMESRPPSLAYVDALEAEHGPLLCTRHHALHDPKHAAELRAQIQKLDDELVSRCVQNEVWTLHEINSRILPKIQSAANYFKAATK